MGISNTVTNFALLRVACDSVFSFGAFIAAGNMHCMKEGSTPDFPGYSSRFNKHCLQKPVGEWVG